MRFTLLRFLSSVFLFGSLYFLICLWESFTDTWTLLDNETPQATMFSKFNYLLINLFPRNKNYEKLPKNLQFTLQNHSKMCEPPELAGPINVWMDEPSIETLEKLYPHLEKGGHGFPENCRAREKVAIIIPYRGRPAHLRILLHNMHHFLTKQLVEYGIFVVEQSKDQVFNRANLINVGFVESQKYFDWDCFVFHDVDMLPEDDRNIYQCSHANPRHMSVALDKYNYTLPYPTYFGGIVALTKNQMENINGYSNNYFGWGGEDDDAFQRLYYMGYKIERYPPSIGKYKMIKHERDDGNPSNLCRFELITKTKEKMMRDGLTNLNYNVVSTTTKHLYTHILIDPLFDEIDLQLENQKANFSVC